jgi:cyanophycin synthetase
VVYTHQIPATFEGRARMMVQNALAAVGAAHAAGAHIHDIRQAMRSFSTSMLQTPGRLNLVDLNGVKVVIDYAHNPHGLEAVGDFVERITAESPTGPPGVPSWQANLRVAVVATPGDRREDDMRELGRVAARHFDDIIIREDEQTRGRQRGETAALVLEGVEEAMRAGVRAGHVEVVLDEEQAVQKALSRSRPGDLVVVCVDHADRVWRELESRRLGVMAPQASPEGDGHPARPDAPAR